MKERSIEVCREKKNLLWERKSKKERKEKKLKKTKEEFRKFNTICSPDRERKKERWQNLSPQHNKKIIPPQPLPPLFPSYPILIHTHTHIHTIHKERIILKL